jgi:hypothetical protein
MVDRGPRFQAQLAKGAITLTTRDDDPPITYRS